MTEVDWIDIHFAPPRHGEEYLVATAKQRRIVATYASGRYWESAEGHYIDDVTHYASLLELPKLPKPKGPFGCYIDEARYWGAKSHRIYYISHGDEEYEIPWPNGTPIGNLVDWLNEMWTKKRETRGMKHRAQLESDDPVIAKRWATGYYCEVEDRHFIILCDAELVRYYLNEALVGFVEVRPETLEEVREQSGIQS